MFELVDKEEAHGLIAGSLYGDRVRVIARSPTHVLFSALGVRCWNRDEHSSHGTQTFTRNRPSRAVYEEIAPRIDAVFGEGAAALIKANNRLSKTVLVDGGGVKLPLPRSTQAKITQANYEKITVDRKVELTGQIACCLQCGKNLRPDTDHHRMGYKLLPDHPRTLEDCQRMTNARVIAVHGYGTHHSERFGYVSWFETWDGETTIDEDFCGDKCAALYGRRAAKMSLGLEVGVEVERKAYRPREDTDHAEPEEPMYANGPDGQRIRLR